MSAISSSLSILLPSYSTAAKHPAGCNCPTCSSMRGGTSATGSAQAPSAGSGQADSAGSGQTNSTMSSDTSAGNGVASDPAAPKDAMGRPLSKSQQADLTELKKTDSAVRRHEQAHLSAAGSYARSGIILNFKVGPDGKQYAVGGHVDIDTSVVAGNPSATIAKMETVARAALAPADPSGQDRNVAAEATQKANQARAQESQQKSSSPSSATAGPASSKAAAKYASASGTTTTGSADVSGQLLDVAG